MYYQEGLGAIELAKKLKKSYSQIYKFMKRRNWTRRLASETNKIKFLRTPLSYAKKGSLTLEEKHLHTAGLMLYWAEGSKVGKFVVDFVNSNSQMTYLFLHMLKTVYQINPERIRILLYCYSNHNPSKLVAYWSNLLKVPITQFTKPYVRHNFDPNKSHKMPNGLIHIRYADTRLLSQIMADIDIIAKELSQDGRAVKYTTL